MQETEEMPPAVVDLSSNDYLGLARDVALRERIDLEERSVRKQGNLVLGSTGSRLLTGDSPYARLLEMELAAFHEAESALLFNSGYDANLSVFATLPQPEGVVIFDELMHASCREGLRTCRSKTREFKHNDLAHFETALKEECDGKKIVLVAIESVYSMDGDVAPVKEMCELAAKYGAEVIVDEAHGLGVYGAKGCGVCQFVGAKPFARVVTFGKALGCHGAVVVGPKAVRSYLLNFAKPLIFSTALPMHSLVTIRASYEHLAAVAEDRQGKLAVLIRIFRDEVARLRIQAVDSPSPIQALIVPGNDRVVELARQLRTKGFWVLPVRAPSVPAGLERIRVVLHSYNSQEEVLSFMRAVSELVSGRAD